MLILYNINQYILNDLIYLFIKQFYLDPLTIFNDLYNNKKNLNIRIGDNNNILLCIIGSVIKS